MPQTPRFGRARSLAGEFLIIVAGVLVALAVDQWRESVADRDLEAHYLERLGANLVSDTASFNWYQTVIETKASVLRDLVSDDPLSRLLGRENPMADLVHSQFLSLQPVRATTFQELQSTGNLKLIQDFGLRGRITEYYLEFDHKSEILSSSPGEYRKLFLESIPGDVVYSWRLDSIPPDPSALESGIRSLLNEPALRAAVNAELGYTAALASTQREFKETAAGMLEDLGHS